MDKVIDTRLVYGFLDAGKTTYIRENIRDDVFYKYGKTLIICFEEGEEDFDPEELAEKNTSVVYYAESEDNEAGDSESGNTKGGDSKSSDGNIRNFLAGSIEESKPDRIYIEMNAMIPGIREALPDCLKVTFSIMFIDWGTMPVYYTNFMQLFKQMASESNQVIFRGCPSKDLLTPYSQAFRLMNPNASYLRRDPMGYHEKAFELFLPYSLDKPVIMITEKEYLPFWLDAFDHPEHYDGKTIAFTDPLEIRKDAGSGKWSCGRVVMTCCMADLQFMSFSLDSDSLCDTEQMNEGWAALDTLGRVASGEYGRRKLVLQLKKVQSAAAPEELILDGRG